MIIKMYTEMIYTTYTKQIGNLYNSVQFCTENYNSY